MGEVATIARAKATDLRWPAWADTPATARLVPGSPRSKALAKSGLAHISERMLPALVWKISPSYLGFLLLDASVLAGTMLLADVCLPPIPGRTGLAAYGLFLLAIAIQEGIYRSHDMKDSLPLGKASAWAWLITVVLLERSARGVASIAIIGILAFSVLSAWRFLRNKFGLQQSRSLQNVLLVGENGNLQEVANAIQSGSPNRLIKARLPSSQFRDMGSATLLARIARQQHIDEVILAGCNRELVRLAISECRRLAINVVVVPPLIGHAVKTEIVNGVPLITAHNEEAPEWQLAIKRLVDFFVASLALLALLPLLCAVALAIKLDSPGPVLYRSMRVGKKGVVFPCYKFRTMLLHDPGLKFKLRLQNERQGAFFKMAADPRITRMGHWLRRYSVDELPQLWNVLRGEMSLVGPRPHPVDDVEGYELKDLQRLDCTPGITGLWQVTARGDPSFQRCIGLDVEYINHWSLLLDLQILGRTVCTVLRGSGV